MADNLFGYTGTQTLARTSPIQVNVKPDLRAANAMDSIIQLASTSLTVAGNIKQERDKTSFLEANKDALAIHDWYQSEQLKTQDAYKKKENLDIYEQALNSLEIGYELNEEYAMTLKSSNHNILSRQKGIVGEEVFKRQIKDTDDSLGLLATSLVGASTEEVSKIMSDATTAYTNLGVTKEEASSKLFDIFMSAKINAISSDDIMSLNFKQLKAEKDSLLKSFDPFLTGKDTDVKLNNTFEKLEKEQARAVTEYLNDYARSETVGNKAFEAELNKYQHALKPIEIQNFKEAKADVLFRKAAREQAIADAKEAKVEKIAMKDFSAMLHNPEVSIEDITARATTLKEKGIISQDEFDSYVAQSKERIENKQYSKLTREVEQQKKEAGFILNQLKSVNTTNVDYDPEMVAGLVNVKSGGLPNEEDIKFVRNYQAQYAVEHNSQDKVKAINTPIFTYPAEVQNGVKKALENEINKALNSDNFSAEAIIKIHKNSDVKGDVQKKFNIDADNPSNAVTAVQNFNSLVSYDRNQTRLLLGDKLFSQLEALSTRVQYDSKEKKFSIPADDVRRLTDIKNNPDLSKVDYKAFNDALAKNNNLIPFKGIYEAGFLFGKTPDELIEEIEKRAYNQKPVKGISLVGYPKDITEDMASVIKEVPKYLFTKDKEAIGVAYNAADNSFYHSSIYDIYSSKIEKIDADGNKVPISTLEEVYTHFKEKMIEDRNKTLREKEQQKTKYGIGDVSFNKDNKGRGGEALKKYSDKALSLNPKYDKETDTYYFNKNSKYGNRPDGTPKGSGWLGEIKTGNGKEVMTEKSIGVNINGKETLIPSIVPTLTQEEIDYMKTHDMPNEAIIQKAVDHANKRIKEGKSPFKN